MNLNKFGKASLGHTGELDFELNLAPIIDCLTVLITFTLVSASFLSVAIFDAGAGLPDTSQTDQKLPPVSIALVLKQGGALEIQVTGEVTKTVTVAAANGALDSAATLAQLQGMHQSWPAVDAVSLSAEPNVDYKAIVKSMETVRQVYPAVMLGGF